MDKAQEILEPFLRDPREAPTLAKRILLESYSGPIPHPKILRGIEDVVPGAARDIIEMAKKEQTHRHRTENWVTAFPYLGMVLGFSGLLASLIGAVYLGIRGHEGLGAALVALPVLTAIGLLIKSRITRPPEVAAGKLSATPKS